MLTKLPLLRFSDVSASNPPLSGAHGTPNLSRWPGRIVWDRKALEWTGGQTVVTV